MHDSRLMSGDEKRILISSASPSWHASGVKRLTQSCKTDIVRVDAPLPLGPDNSNLTQTSGRWPLNQIHSTEKTVIRGLLELVGLLVGWLVGFHDISTIVNDLMPNLLHHIYPNPSTQEGYDTRSIFKRSLAGLNSEFSFSWTSCQG